MSHEILTLGVEVATGECALIGLGEDIIVLFLDLGRDILEPWSKAQDLSYKGGYQCCQNFFRQTRQILANFSKTRKNLRVSLITPIPQNPHIIK